MTFRRYLTGNTRGRDFVRGGRSDIEDSIIVDYPTEPLDEQMGRRANESIEAQYDVTLVRLERIPVSSVLEVKLVV